MLPDSCLIVPLVFLIFVFTNSLQESKPDWRWQLTPSGRFAHKKEYVESVSKQHSFHVVHYEPLINFRYEGGVGVQGHVFVIQKKADDHNEL